MLKLNIRGNPTVTPHRLEQGGSPATFYRRHGNPGKPQCDHPLAAVLLLEEGARASETPALTASVVSLVPELLTGFG